MADWQQTWNNLAPLRLKLSATVRFSCQRYRGVSWYLIHDTSSGKYFRCSTEAYSLLKLLDGSRDLASAYGLMELGERAAVPQQSELISLFIGLHNANLLTGWGADEQEERLARHHRLQSQQRVQRWLRPLMMKLPLWNPDGFLHRWVPVIGPMFSRQGFMLWAVVVVFALLQAIGHWAGLKLYWETRFLDTSNLLYTLALYPIVKFIHELGHGFATKRWGGQVNEMGVMLLVFIPLPYVDATASHNFYHKRQRMIVSAAGIMVETLIAAIAMLGWLALDTSTSKDICFNLMVICGISTLLFNGNPLLRFDGYYVLMDAIEIPNLGSRSTRYYRYLFRKYCLRIEAGRTPVTAKGERAWFLFYGLTSTLYRVYISFAIAFYVAAKYFVFGLMLALWALIGQLLIPIVKGVFGLFQDAKNARKERRFLVVSGVMISFIMTLLFAVPYSRSVTVEGVVTLDGDSRITAQVAGFRSSPLVPSGQQVQEDQVVALLQNPDLDSKRKLLQAEIRELDIKRDQVLLSDQSQAKIYQSIAKSKLENLQEIEDEIEGLQAKSSKNGVLYIPSVTGAEGRWVTKGETLAYVIDPTSLQAVLAVRQQDIEAITGRNTSLQIRFTSDPSRTYSGKLINEVPMASTELPSPLLGSQQGGSILVDARDAEGVTAIGSVFLFTVAIDDWSNPSYVGARVRVRFDRSPQLLGVSLYRKVHQFLALN